MKRLLKLLIYSLITVGLLYMFYFVNKYQEVKKYNDNICQNIYGLTTNCDKEK